VAPGFLISVDVAMYFIAFVCLPDACGGLRDTNTHFESKRLREKKNAIKNLKTDYVGRAAHFMILFSSAAVYFGQSFRKGIYISTQVLRSRHSLSKLNKT
jgi:hypothetical protein